MAKQTQVVAEAAVETAAVVEVVAAPAAAVEAAPSVASVPSVATAATESTEHTEAAKPAPPPADLASAEQALARFLGLQGSQANTELRGCTDAEVNAIVAAAAEKNTARQGIKDILSRAYDRRREAAAVEASAEATSAARSALAQRTLETFLGLGAEAANAEVAKLSETEQEQLARLADSKEAFTAETVGHVLKAAAERLSAGK